MGGGGGSVGSGFDNMTPSPIDKVDDHNDGRSSKDTKPGRGSPAEMSARVASAGGSGDGEWSVQTFNVGPDKRSSLPKLEEGRKGGRARGRDVDGRSTSGEPEEPRPSGKWSRSSRQRSTTRTPRKGDGGGADYESPSSVVSLARADDDSRRGGLGDREKVARGRVGAESERGSHQDRGSNELEMSRTLLSSSSSVSSPASIVASGSRSLAPNEDRIVTGQQVVAADHDGGSEGGGRRARPPRLDL